MDPSNGKASSFERRSSIRRSLRLSTTNGGTAAAADDDDYDLSAMMVADGFRPSDHATSASIPPASSHSHRDNEVDPSSAAHPPQLPPINASPPLSSTTKIPSDQAPEMRNRPSSISKPPRNHDSLALRNDGTSTSAAGGAQIPRVSSMSSDAPVMRAESPYRGPSGPSHPYQMYPQRTMSVATTSTTAAAAAAIIPEDQAYSGPRGPTHPYTLYPQNTVPTGDTSGPPIPVGFNNMGGSYQRQIGPDGEDAGDMIGPLGHLEELPPYSRYPENSFVPKTTTGSTTETTSASSTSPATVTVASTATTTAAAAVATSTATTDRLSSPEPASPNRTIAGAGGIGIATRDPEFSSTEDDFAMPRTRPSVRSTQSDASHHDVNTAARDLAEKPTMNKWQRRAKKKLWGIVPYWAICLLTVGLILMGIIMGAVIGTLLSRQHKKPPPSATTTAAETSDVQTLTAVPTDIKPMATGHFTFPSFETQTQRLCCNDTTKSQSWSCDLAFPFYSMDITQVSDAEKKPTQGYQLNINPFNSTEAKFLWGTHPPVFTSPIRLSLVTDNYKTEYGPAWYAKFSYNKTVVVSTDDFSSGSSSSKRGYDDRPYPPPPRFKKKGVSPKPNELAWICTWPNVISQVFIYPNQNTSTHFGSTTTTTTTGTATTSSAYTTTTQSSSNSLPLSYPRVVKMFELRYTAEDSIATCQQIKVSEDGNGCQPQKDEHGNLIEVVIVENKSSATQRYRQIPKRWYIRELLARGSTTPDLTQCSCVWWST